MMYELFIFLAGALCGFVAWVPIGWALARRQPAAPPADTTALASELAKQLIERGFQ